MFFEDEMTLLDIFVFGFGVPYLVIALVLGSKVSDEMSTWLDLNYYIDVINGRKKVIKKRSYKPAEERTKEDKSRDLPRRLTKADHNKSEKQLPLVKKAKSRLLMFLLITYGVHQIATIAMFPNEMIKWLVAPGYFVVFYSACLIARWTNGKRHLAYKEGYRSGGF